MARLRRRTAAAPAKPWWTSKTLWLAVGSGLTGVSAALLASEELKAAGLSVGLIVGAIVLRELGAIVLRALTDKPIR